MLMFNMILKAFNLWHCDECLKLNLPNYLPCTHFVVLENIDLSSIMGKTYLKVLRKRYQKMEVFKEKNGRPGKRALKLRMAPYHFIRN